MAKKVLILTPFFRPNIGGAETHLNDLCEYLRTHNFYVYVITYQPLTTEVRGLSHEKKRNLEVRRIAWFGQNLFHRLEPYSPLEFLYLFPGLFIATLLFMFKNSREIDAIHAHGLIAATISRLITLLYPKRTALSIHAIYHFEKKPLMAKIVEWILFGFSTVLALAHVSQKDLIAAGVSPEKIEVYNQWVDQELFKIRKKTYCRQRLNLKGDFFVLFVGRLIEKKGIRVLLQVASDLPKTGFVFVGDGPMAGELKKAARQQGNIYAVGGKTQKEVALYYGAADVVVVPSQYKEGFARVVLEALSSGRPVIASNKGCLPEMISREVGILVKPSKENIKKAILSLYKKPQLLAKLTANSRSYAEKHFSEKNAAKIAATYS